MEIRDPDAWDLTNPYSICELTWKDREEIKRRAVELRRSMSEDDIARQAIEAMEDIKRWRETRGLTLQERLDMVTEFLVLDKALWLKYERQ